MAAAPNAELAAVAAAGCTGALPAEALATKRRRSPAALAPGGPVLVDLTGPDAAPAAGACGPRAAALLTPETLVRLAGLVGLRAACLLAAADRAGREALRGLLGTRLAHLSRWARDIWVEGPLVARDAARAAMAGPLPAELRCLLLDALSQVAAARNRCPLQVAVLCYLPSAKGGATLKIDFRCPRRHGPLQAVRGIPTVYVLRHSTDDLTLSCSNCYRGEIEEDPKLFHCPRFGCCYDLCLLCAEGLARHRHPGRLSWRWPRGGADGVAPAGWGRRADRV